MATVTLTNVFVAGTPAVATQVNTNFTDITDQVNGNLDADNYADNSVTDAKLRTSAAYSIVGRAGATVGNVADIAAASANTVLQRGASGLEFATVGNASVATGIDAAKIADGSVSNTEFQYLDGVTSAIQTQLNGKQATLGTGGVTETMLATDAVTTTKIENGAVTADKLAVGAVGTSDIEQLGQAIVGIPVGDTFLNPGIYYFRPLNASIELWHNRTGTFFNSIPITDVNAPLLLISSGDNIKITNTSASTVNVSWNQIYLH